MIIFEGADLVGKTSLALALCKSIPSYKYEHMSRLPDDFHRFYGYMPLMRANKVLDRFFVSEPIYAAVREETTPMRPEWAIALQREAVKLGGMSVFITASEELIASRYHHSVMMGRFEMYSLDEILKANSLFYKVACGDPIQECQFHCDLHLHMEGDCDIPGMIAKIREYHTILLNRSAYLRSTREFPKGAVSQA